MNQFSTTMATADVRIHVDDFKKLINPLTDYLDQESIKTAIHSLEQFYKDEAFDSEDITNDWIPNDFENCDGIDIFVNALNYTERINNALNKKLLFDWFCHWLLPNTSKPSQKPMHPIANTTRGPLPQLKSPKCPIEQIGHQFAKKMEIYITEFSQLHTDKLEKITRREKVIGISEWFVKICKEEKVKFSTRSSNAFTYVTNKQYSVDELCDDFEEDDIENILIFELFMSELPKYKHLRSKLFDLLLLIILKKDYLRFNLGLYFTDVVVYIHANHTTFPQQQINFT